MVAEPAGQPPPVLGGSAALVLVVCDALGDRAAVPGADLGERGVAEAGVAGGAGGGSGGVRVDEEVDHGPRPDLAFGVELIDTAQVTQAMRAHQACSASARWMYPA